MKLKLLLAVPLLFSFGAMASQGSDFSKLSPHDALDKVNSMYQTGEAMAQVTPNSIIAKFKDGSSGSVDLADEFLVSIAPYINSNHPCGIHMPTGCTGEIKGKDFKLMVFDLDSNKEVLFKTIKSNPSGFIDLWLPKDRKHLEVTITYGGKVTKKVISTTKNSNTCITDMKLKEK